MLTYDENSDLFCKLQVRYVSLKQLYFNVGG